MKNFYQQEINILQNGHLFVTLTLLLNWTASKCVSLINSRNVENIKVVNFVEISALNSLSKKINWWNNSVSFLNWLYLNAYINLGNTLQQFSICKDLLTTLVNMN